MEERGARARPAVYARLWLFGLANYLALLALVSRYLGTTRPGGLAARLFEASVIVSYPALFSFAALAPAALLLAARPRSWEVRRPRLFTMVEGLAAALAVAGASLLVLALYTDLRTYRIFGFHLNGFIWNLITTRGGLASLGAGGGSLAVAASAGVAVLAAEGLLLLSLSKLAWLQRLLRPLYAPHSIAALSAIAVLLLFAESFGYGWSELHGDRSVMQKAEAFPLFVTVSFKGIAKSLGYHPPPAAGIEFNRDDSALRYPLEPLRGRPSAPAYNVVWLCAESLRADMLDPEIMPATWDLAQRSAQFRNHVSGGSGTRMGIFSMFYGLPGSYWFSFLDEQRGPVLVDRLLELDYQLEALTSDDFSYPEFAKTVWSRIDSAHLVELGESGGAGWERDRRNTRELMRFVAQRDPARRFFVFSFFESPHARYEFPPESVIRKPFLADFNYVSSDLVRDIGLIKNRYVNSVHHLDSQFAQLFEFLRQQGLLETTIVIVTGDHGEEFMENGRWGHNSGVSEAQIRVPLLIYVPGRAPEVVDRLTSHLDLPATLLELLGVENAPETYSVGMDLFGEHRRSYAYLADWDTVTYLDAELKLRFPVGAAHGTGEQVYTRGDLQIAKPAAQLMSRHDDLTRMLEDLARFRRRG